MAGYRYPAAMYSRKAAEEILGGSKSRTRNTNSISIEALSYR